MNTTKYSGDDVLDVMAAYASNRNTSIEKLIVKFLRLDDLKLPSLVLEFGAGKGEFITRLVSRKNFKLIAVEIDPSYKNKLSENVIVYDSIDDVPEALDAIFLIDVLEHLEDDNYYLKRFYQKLKKGGRLFIYVPARKELYSSFDKKIGHFRRYSIKDLKGKVENAGFNIEKVRYHELLGYFTSILNKWFLSNKEMNITAVKIYDRFIVPTTNFIEKYIRAPFGKSIYLSALKKE